VVPSPYPSPPFYPQQRIKKFDAFPKIRDEEFYQRTLSGGVITIVAGVLMLSLFLSELTLYLRLDRTHELVVDTSRGEQIEIFLDVTFPRMPCAWTSLDVMDVSGEMHLDVDHDVYKIRLDTQGRQIREDRTPVGPQVQGDEAAAAGTTGPSGNSTCGDCYGAETNPGDCCNTCDEVREAYRRKGWALIDPLNVAQCAKDHHLTELRAQEGEGCRLKGTVKVNKVAGNFHFAPGKSFQQGYMHLHDLSPFRADQFFDFTHKINKISFGKDFPGIVNPLDGTRRDHLALAVSGMWQYYIKVREGRGWRSFLT
jgi:endoplasmic reticulum-Golgi intermediate compartment protein 3